MPRRRPLPNSSLRLEGYSISKKLNAAPPSCNTSWHLRLNQAAAAFSLQCGNLGDPVAVTLGEEQYPGLRKSFLAIDEPMPYHTMIAKYILSLRPPATPSPQHAVLMSHQDSLANSLRLGQRCCETFRWHLAQYPAAKSACQVVRRVAVAACYKIWPQLNLRHDSPVPNGLLPRLVTNRGPVLWLLRTPETLSV
jgi:hypothetical protein